MQSGLVVTVAFWVVVMLLIWPRVLWATEAGQSVFSWVPGEREARVGKTPVAMKMGPQITEIDCPVGRALRCGPDGLIGRGQTRLGTIPERGTIDLWVRLDRRIQVCPRDDRVSAKLVHCEDLTIYLRENDNGVSVNVEGGHEVRRPNVRGLASFDLTHLRADQWYHIAIRYDAPEGKWRLILNGVLQPEPWFFGPFKFRDLTQTIEFNGLMTSKEGKGEPARVALGPITWQAGAAEPQEVLARLKTVKGWSVPPNRGEGVLEEPEDFDGEALGGEVIYENVFDAPLEDEQWVLEGPARLDVADGRLLVHNREGNHCVLWLKKRLPRDFVAAWDVQPSQMDGLAIVFLSAMGADGRDLFDPTLARRDSGEFPLYTRGDIRCYHFSYYAGQRGSANMRKNPGFYMIGLGPELIGSKMMTGATGPFRVVVVRRGKRIECAVDGKRFLFFEDDGQTYGPAHGAGYFGLRQMGQSRTIAYDNLVIRELKE